MKTIKATLLSYRTVKIMEKETGSEKTLYKGAYITDDDIFIAFTQKVPDKASNFVKLDGKYKKLDI